MYEENLASVQRLDSPDYILGVGFHWPDHRVVKLLCLSLFSDPRVRKLTFLLLFSDPVPTLRPAVWAVSIIILYIE